MSVIINPLRWIINNKVNIITLNRAKDYLKVWHSKIEMNCFPNRTGDIVDWKLSFELMLCFTFNNFCYSLIGNQRLNYRFTLSCYTLQKLISLTVNLRSWYEVARLCINMAYVSPSVIFSTRFIVCQKKKKT